MSGGAQAHPTSHSRGLQGYLGGGRSLGPGPQAQLACPLLAGGGPLVGPGAQAHLTGRAIVVLHKGRHGNGILRAFVFLRGGGGAGEGALTGPAVGTPADRSLPFRGGGGRRGRAIKVRVGTRVVPLCALPGPQDPVELGTLGLVRPAGTFALEITVLGASPVPPRGPVLLGAMLTPHRLLGMETAFRLGRGIRPTDPRVLDVGDSPGHSPISVIWATPTLAIVNQSGESFERALALAGHPGGAPLHPLAAATPPGVRSGEVI